MDDAGIAALMDDVELGEGRAAGRWLERSVVCILASEISWDRMWGEAWDAELRFDSQAAGNRLRAGWPRRLSANS